MALRSDLVSTLSVSMDIKMTLAILKFRPEYIHPFASAIDTPLEVPEKMVSAGNYAVHVHVLVAGGVAH